MRSPTDLLENHQASLAPRERRCLSIRSGTIRLLAGSGKAELTKFSLMELVNFKTSNQIERSIKRCEGLGAQPSELSSA